MNIAQLKELVNSLDPSLDQCQLVVFVEGRLQPRTIELQVAYKNEKDKFTDYEEDEKVVLMW